MPTQEVHEIQYLLGNANMQKKVRSWIMNCHSIVPPSVCVCVCVSNALFLYGSTGGVNGGFLTDNSL